MIADILVGRATQRGYALLLRNLLPVYQALEQQLSRHSGSALLAPISRRELARTGAIEADLNLTQHPCCRRQLLTCRPSSGRPPATAPG
jgi:heme oxygenase